MRNFKKLKIWQKGIVIAGNCYEIARSFPSSEKWSIGNQITRAAVSIPSNIAEGSSRSSHKEYNRFIEISIGSAYELETQLLICQLTNLGNVKLITETIGILTEEEKMLLAFRKTLQTPI